MISIFCRVLHVVFFLLGDSPASEKRRNIKLRRRGITQKKEHNNLITVSRTLLTQYLFVEYAWRHVSKETAIFRPFGITKMPKKLQLHYNGITWIEVSGVHSLVYKRFSVKNTEVQK